MYARTDTNWPHETVARRQAYGNKKTFLAVLMFVAAYFTSVTVNAQSDAIQLNSNKVAVITGTVVEASENYVVIDSAGKKMKIVLDDVHLQGPADTVFSPGMQVSVDVKITGDDFGVLVVKAHSITATEASATTEPVIRP